MLTCNECGFQQEEGNFCGKCGGKLSGKMGGESKKVDEKPEAQQAGKTQQLQHDEQTQQAYEEIASTSEASSQNTNEVVDKFVAASKNYGDHFTKYLKSPSRIFSTASREVTNGLISIAIVAALIAFTFYRLAVNVSYYIEPKFFSTFGNGFIFFLIAIAIVITVLFLISKNFGKQYSFQDMISIFGVHMIPLIILSGVALLLVLMKSNTVGAILFFVTIAFVVSIFPLYLISSLVTQNPKRLDPIYGYVIYVVSVSIAFSIYSTILFDSTFGHLIRTL